MYKKQGLPEKNDLVICTIKEATPSSVFVILDEYDKLEGMIHVSEITRRWVRGMKTYLKAGMKLVCQVMDVDRVKKFVNVSSRRVGAGQQRNKMAEWSNEKKADDILEIFAKQNGMTSKAVYDAIGNKGIQKYNLLYPFLKEVAAQGEARLAELGVDKKLAGQFVEFVQKRIVPPKAQIDANLMLVTNASNGVELVKKIINEVKDAAKKGGAEMDVKYLGAPNYKLTLISKNFKKLEETFKTISDYIVKAAEKSEGTATIKRA